MYAEPVYTERGADAAVGAHPRVGFAGLGWIGQHRMRAVVDRHLVEVAALADPLDGCLAESSRVAPNAARFLELGQLLEGDLDGVVISTPSAMHAHQSLQALERGFALFCQKPLGLTALETRTVIEAAEAGNRLLSVDFSYRHVEGLRRMRELIQEGQIGDVFAARAVFHNAYGPGKEWFFDRRASGGGCVIDLGIHLVDIIYWTLGFPEVERVTSRLYSGGRPLAKNADVVEDYAVARLDLSGGAVAEIACSWNLSTGCDAVIEVDFFGTLGSVSLRNIDGSYFDFVARHCRGRSLEVIAEPPDDWGSGAIVGWAQQLCRSNAFDPAVWDVVDVAETIDAIYAGNTT